MLPASTSRVDEGVHESDQDGVHFGDRCERRVFFPGSNKQHTAVADDVHGAQQRASAATDPLSALGLLPSSPYTLLRESAPAPGHAVQEETTNSNRARRSNSPKQQRACEAPGRGDRRPLELPWTTAAATSTSCRGNRFRSPTPEARHRRPSQEASYEEIYSPQKLQRSRDRLKRRADENHGRPAYSAAAGGLFDDDESAIFLLQKIRAGERATAEEAARLRCAADASVMIRRFWRRSG